MKKQLIIVALISIWTCEIFSLTPGQQRLLKETPGRVIDGMKWNGSAFVKAGSNDGGQNGTGGGQNGTGGGKNLPALPTPQEMQKAVAADPQGAAAACAEALKGMQQSGTPNSTVLNYIMGGG